MKITIHGKSGIGHGDNVKLIEVDLKPGQAIAMFITDTGQEWISYNHSFFEIPRDLKLLSDIVKQ